MNKFLLVHKNGSEKVFISTEDVESLNGLKNTSFFCFNSIKGEKIYIRKKDIDTFRSIVE